MAGGQGSTAGSDSHSDTGIGSGPRGVQLVLVSICAALIGMLFVSMGVSFCAKQRVDKATAAAAKQKAHGLGKGTGARQRRLETAASDLEAFAGPGAPPAAAATAKFHMHAGRGGSPVESTAETSIYTGQWIDRERTMMEGGWEFRSKEDVPSRGIRSPVSPELEGYSYIRGAEQPQSHTLQTAPTRPTAPGPPRPRLSPTSSDPGTQTKPGKPGVLPPGAPLRVLSPNSLMLADDVSCSGTDESLVDEVRRRG